MTLTEELTTAVRHECPDAPAAATSTLTVERLTCQDWDTACAQFDGICPEQTYAFSRVRWPSLQHEPLLFRRGHEVVGGALMMIQPLPLRLGAVAIGKWAPMLRDGRRADSRLLYRGMIDSLIAEYADGRGMMLSILPRAFGDVRNDETEYLSRRGFVAGSNVPFPSRYIADLRHSEDDHRRLLGPKWRYHLNKSEKNELTFEAADRALLPQFAALYEAMCDRKQFPDHSAYNTVPALMAMQMDCARPQLFFVRHHGEIVCGAVIFTAGDTAIYLYGATNDHALPLRAGYFMHWQIIRWLKTETGARWYDLGGSDGFLGLHQFKKGMIGKAGAIVPLPPMMHFARRKLPLMAGRSAFAIRDALLNVRERFSIRWSNGAKPDLTPNKM
jgi:hypothetical protein